MEMLLQNAQSPMARLQSILPLIQGSSTGASGLGALGNDQVDVLSPDDPRLRSGFGVTLARPAYNSLVDLLRQYGFHGDAGGGYRTPQEQANLYSSKPGVAARPGSSYHQEGLAIDLAAALQNPRFFNLLRQAGWNQLAGEPWHWSYGVSG